MAAAVVVTVVTGVDYVVRARTLRRTSPRPGQAGPSGDRPRCRREAVPAPEQTAQTSERTAPAAEQTAAPAAEALDRAAERVDPAAPEPPA